MERAGGCAGNEGAGQPQRRGGLDSLARTVAFSSRRGSFSLPFLLYSTEKAVTRDVEC